MGAPARRKQVTADPGLGLIPVVLMGEKIHSELWQRIAPAVFERALTDVNSRSSRCQYGTGASSCSPAANASAATITMALTALGNRLCIVQGSPIGAAQTGRQMAARRSVPRHRSRRRIVRTSTHNPN